jgi:hypothetical protein
MLFLKIDGFSHHFFEELCFFLFFLPGEDGLFNSFLDNLSVFGLKDFFFGFLKFVDSGENSNFGAVGFGLGLDER